MKVLKLKGLQYLNHKGIIMSKYSDGVLATKQNIEILQPFIRSGAIVIEEKTFEEEIAEVIEEPVIEVVEVIEPVQEIEAVEEIADEPETQEEFEEKVYTAQELKDMNKEELVKVAETLVEDGLVFRKSWKVGRIEEAIIEFQKTK